MSKPSWEDAPEWANWLALDDFGEWWLFENKPSFNSGVRWVDFAGGAKKWSSCFSSETWMASSSLERRQ